MSLLGFRENNKGFYLKGSFMKMVVLQGNLEMDYIFVNHAAIHI